MMADFKATVTHHDGGVTVDFRLPEDPRAEAQRRAWWVFEVGIFLLMESIVWFAVCIMTDWTGAIFLCVPTFMVGIGLLIAAANISSRGWRDLVRDDVCRQIAVADNMLVRTSLDHSKQVWVRDEIHALTVEPEAVTTEGHSTTMYVLTIHDRAGGKSALLRVREPGELERIADLLRKALHPNAVSLEHGIQADKTHIMK